MSDFVTPWTIPQQASLSFTTSRNLLKLMSIEWVMPSSHLILCCPFAFCLQFSLVSVSFQMSQLFSSGGQSIGASASELVLPKNIKDWFLLGLTGLIFSWSKRLSRVFSLATATSTVSQQVKFAYLDCEKHTFPKVFCILRAPWVHILQHMLGCRIRAVVTKMEGEQTQTDCFCWSLLRQKWKSHC